MNDKFSTNSNESELKKIRNRVKLLQKKPQPEQRTPEWFKQRQTRITASEAASCLYKSQNVCEIYVKEFGIQNFKYNELLPLNPYETKEDYIIKKCSAFFGEAVFKDTVFTLWGKKYEEVANRVYCKLNNTEVYEFGLLSHSRLNWLAASPDGITKNGIMLEIKCPKARKIDPKVVPLYYWIQCQIQLETCNLEECDFFECEIEEIETEEQFKNIQIEGSQDLGIVLEIPKENPEQSGDPKFIYPPYELNTAIDYINWKNDILISQPNLTVTYFFIKRYNTIRVKRSKEWFNNVKNDIKNTWSLIMKLQSKQDDFEKYKHSIHLLRNKSFLEKFDNTCCLIDDNTSVFEFEDLNPDTEMTDAQQNNINNITQNITFETCQIESSN